MVNTFLFRADFTGQIPLFDGKLLIRQQYRGSTIRTSTLATRDDEDLLLRYDVPLSSVLSFILTQSARISSDTRSIGLNALQQFNAHLGLAYSPKENIMVKGSAGGEYNEQLGIIDRGVFVDVYAGIQRQNFDEYLLSGEIQAAASALTNSRTNTQTNVRLSLSRTFENGGYLELRPQYTTLHREFYTSLVPVGLPIGSATTPAVETRREQLFRLYAKVVFPVFQSVEADVQGNFENWLISRQYRQPVQGITFTSARRDVDQVRFSLQSTLRISLAESNYQFGMTIDTRDEINSLTERFPLGTFDLQTLQNAEKQRDNISLKSSLLFQSLWRLSRSDTLQYSFSSSLLRYDTPSTSNYDDRDELLIASSIMYTHKFSPFFSGTLFVETRLAHLLFLFSQRSAQNNWNRIFKITPSFFYTSKNFTARPIFELLANYTSFDFAEISNAAQSFSFRQIQYKDSLTFRLPSGLTLESRLIFRYFERGEFQWNEFKEFPRDKNHEIFIRVLMFSGAETAVPSFRYGFGGRFYVLSQQPANSVVRITEFYNQTVGPEVLMEFPFLSGTVVRINGWYEFQFDRNQLLRQVPNVFISTVLPL